MTDTFLPPGIHPRDPSVDYSGGTLPTDMPAPHDLAGNRFATTHRRPFDTNPAEALAVWQRASSDWTARVVSVDANSGGTALVVGRQRGRGSVTVWVPSTLPNGTSPNGVVIAASEDEAQSAMGGVALNPGDSITINTEGPVYAGLIGANTTGACQVVVDYNPSDTIGF